MTTISDPGSSPPTKVFSVASIPDLVRDGLLDATDVYQPEPGRPRYFWPANDEVVITVPGLPEDCTPIEAAIREYMGFIGTDSHIRFPVKDIEVDRTSGRIRIIGDPNRISEMRPLPRR